VSKARIEAKRRFGSLAIAICSTSSMNKECQTLFHVVGLVHFQIELVFGNNASLTSVINGELAIQVNEC
jgi:hypothetical protein